MKTYAPKGLHGADLRAILADLHATPAQVAKFLKVTERSVFRWLSDDSAPYSVLAALWHETPRGREVTAADVGTDLDLTRGRARIAQDQAAAAGALLVRVLAISDTGAANDPVQLVAGQAGPPPGRPARPDVKNPAALPGPGESTINHGLQA